MIKIAICFSYDKAIKNVSGGNNSYEQLIITSTFSPCLIPKGSYKGIVMMMGLNFWHHLIPYVLHKNSTSTY